ncbi:MAG: hypothetical protein ACPGLY_27625 [Rubripirellula sp.]
MFAPCKILPEFSLAGIQQLLQLLIPVNSDVGIETVRFVFLIHLGLHQWILCNPVEVMLGDAAVLADRTNAERANTDGNSFPKNVLNAGGTWRF